MDHLLETKNKAEENIFIEDTNILKHTLLLLNNIMEKVQNPCPHTGQGTAPPKGWATR